MASAHGLEAKTRRLAYRLIDDYREDGYAFYADVNHFVREIKPQKDGLVYATYFPDYAIIKALTSEGLIPKKLMEDRYLDAIKEELTITGLNINIRLPIEWKEYVINGICTVYMVPTDELEESDIYGWKLTSDKPIKPVDKTFADFSTFLMFGGCARWRIVD